MSSFVFPIVHSLIEALHHKVHRRLRKLQGQQQATTKEPNSPPNTPTISVLLPWIIRATTQIVSRISLPIQQLRSDIEKQMNDIDELEVPENLEQMTTAARAVPAPGLPLATDLRVPEATGMPTGTAVAPSRERLPEIESLFDKDDFAICFIGNMAMYLSLGTLFPILGICICVSVVVQLKYTKHKIVQFVQSVVVAGTWKGDSAFDDDTGSGCDVEPVNGDGADIGNREGSKGNNGATKRKRGMDPLLRRLNEDLKSPAGSIYDSLWMIIPLNGLVHSLFVFDTIGDNEGLHSGIFVVVAMIASTLITAPVIKMLLKLHKKQPSGKVKPMALPRPLHPTLAAVAVSPNDNSPDCARANKEGGAGILGGGDGADVEMGNFYARNVKRSTLSGKSNRLESESESESESEKEPKKLNVMRIVSSGDRPRVDVPGENGAASIAIDGRHGDEVAPFTPEDQQSL